MLRIVFLTAFVLPMLTSPDAQAQDARHNNNLSYGLKGGGTYSMTDNLETTILSEPYYLDYSLVKKWKTGFTAGGFVDYNIENSVVVLSLDLTYASQGSELYFNNQAKSFHYTMDFNYQYINFLPQVKFYPFTNYDETYQHGFYAAVGMQIGLNVAPEGITYKSGGPGYLPAFGSDLEQQQQLRNVLKGKTDAGPSIGIGWRTATGWSFEGRFFYGITDVVETEANSYNFIENKNSNKVAQLTVAYDFGLLGRR
jgi:outer membrane protein with beta-barrel domain